MHTLTHVAEHSVMRRRGKERRRRRNPPVKLPDFLTQKPTDLRQEEYFRMSALEELFKVFLGGGERIGS